MPRTSIRKKEAEEGAVQERGRLRREEGGGSLIGKRIVFVRPELGTCSWGRRTSTFRRRGKKSNKARK